MRNLARAAVIAATVALTAFGVPAAAQAVPHPDITEEVYVGPVWNPWGYLCRIINPFC